MSKDLQAWPSSFQKPSDIYKKVVNNGQHPPLMQYRSWNLAVPYKEQRFAHTASESIANNYTPTASELKVKLLPAKKFKTPPREDEQRRSASDFQTAFYQPPHRFNKKDVLTKKYVPFLYSKLLKSMCG